MRHKMASRHFLSLLLLLTHHTIFYCASAAVHHSHSVDSNERDVDGAYKPRDAEHYSGFDHNVDFDHEAILGSVKEAEEFDKLSPAEAKARLALLLPKMDLNGDKIIDRDELYKWILKSFINISREEAQERLAEADDNRDGVVSWSEYLQDAFGVDHEEDLDPDDTAENGLLISSEKIMWQAADKNGDSVLDADEFEVFTNPEEHASMHPLLISQTLSEKDKNGDGHVDFNEFLGERGARQDKEWLVTERDRFENEYDQNRDGLLDADEIRSWIIPDNNEIAQEEVDHLFEAADDDRDDKLSFEEILAHHDVFVGSEATDYGSDLMGGHFDDEL